MKASRIAMGDRRALVPSAAVALLVAVVVGLGGTTASAQAASCTATVTSLAGLQYWVGLRAGSTVCLANGSYGRRSLSVNKPGGGITIAR